ncbi:MAG: phosphatidylglycerol lysyltransferase domain-containing protein, partial [Ilumatobacteraceae bacterium]
TRPDHTHPAEPTVVAAHPRGGPWALTHVRVGPRGGRRRVRRIAAGLLVAAGVLDIVSVFARQLRDLGVVERVLPFTVFPVAGVAGVLTGCALIGLARGARLGRRRAWLASLVLLVVAALAHVVMGSHVEEAVLGLLLAGWLGLQRRHFRVNPPGRGRWLARLVMGALFTIVLMTGLGYGIEGETSTARLAVALAIGLVVLLVLLVGRFRGPPAAGPEDRDLAGRIVAHHGVRPFDDLVLADGNRWLFSGDSVVAYTVHDDVMTVSPDPVGPPTGHADAWADAMDLADQFGWSIAVRGAAPDWLAVYRAAGLTDTFVGVAVVVPVSVVAGETAGLAPVVARTGELAALGYRVETEGSGDALRTVAKDVDGQVVLAHDHRWSARLDGWLLVGVAGVARPQTVVTGLADAVVLDTLGWMGDHRGIALALGPVPDHGLGPDLERWAALGGVTVEPRYDVGDSARTGPGRRRRT